MKPCPVCGSQDSTPLFVQTLRHRRYVNTLCRRCGMAWVSTRAKPSEYERFYTGDYAAKVYGFTGDAASIKEIIAWRTRRSKQKLQPFGKFWKRGTRVLEVGTGPGAFLKVLESAYGCRVWGIEPSPIFAKIARRYLGIKIYLGRVETWLSDKRCAFPKKFDVIVLDQVLEHILDPFKLIRDLSARLTEDGLLFLSVPNISAPKDTKKGLFVFEHVSGFSPFSLNLFLARLGFKLIALHAEAPGSLQVVAARFSAPFDMLPPGAVGKPLGKAEILKNFPVK
ncbi:MAG: class I SAM-dependent methyltransferase [Patescibacteria group bacterium]